MEECDIPVRDDWCWKCEGTGAYCWTCGEIEDACRCEPGDRNIGDCEACDEQ